MRPSRPAPSMAARVSADAKIASFAADIVGADKPFAVVDGAGKPIGEVTPQAVIDLLAGHRPAGERAHDGDAASPRARAGDRFGHWPVVWARRAARRARASILLRDTSALGRRSIPTAPSCRSPNGSAPLMSWLKIEPLLADALDHRGARRAAATSRSTCWPRTARSATAPEAMVLPRLSWVGVVAAACLAGHAAGGRKLGAAGRRLLPLHRAVRPMGQRHADAGADRHRRAALRRHRAAGRHLGLAHACASTGWSSRPRST